MPRKSRREIVKELDHAFELALILITVISATIAQFVTTEQKINLPPIIANMQRLSIVFIFPATLAIIAWISIYFIDDESWQMRLKTYAWASITTLALFQVFELFTLCMPKTYPRWLDFFIVLFFSAGMFFIPWLLTEKVLERYKMALKNINFFTVEGSRSKLIQLIPLFLSWVVFWLTFAWAMLV